MSRAEPMAPWKRRRLYDPGYGTRLTPAQRSRDRHKTRRVMRAFMAGDGHYPGEHPLGSRSPAKGRPTPRQRKPRRG